MHAAMRPGVIPERNGPGIPLSNLRAATWAPFSAAVGALSAFLWLVGRWAPGRLEGGEGQADVPPWLQPRAAAAAAVLILGGIVVLLNAPRPHPEGARRRWRWFLGLATAWFVWMLASALWAPEPDLARQKALEVVILAAGGAGLAGGIWRGEARACRSGFLAAATVGLTVLAAVGVMTEQTGRAAALGGGPNVFGRNMGVLGLLALGAWQAGLGRAWLALAGLAGVHVLLSGSRGALGATLAGLATFSLLSGRGLSRRAAIPIGVALAAGAVFVIEPRLWEAARDLFAQRFLDRTLAQGHMGYRDLFFDLALELTWTAPIRGVGLAGYPALTGIIYPHNLPLEVACEAGLVGLALLLAVAGRWAALVAHLRPLDPVAIAVWVVLLGSAQLSGDLYDSRGLLTWGLIAVAAGLAHRAEERPADEAAAT
ncbi:MAG: O-antigen ligase family protein [Planctomycetes bacterium]|nr:O-antigen ligase family protein [Planctomycetota bacterium]